MALINKELNFEEEVEDYLDLHYHQELDGRNLHPLVDLAAETCEAACTGTAIHAVVTETQPVACANALEEATTTGIESACSLQQPDH